MASILVSPMQQEKIEDHEFSVLYEASLYLQTRHVFYPRQPHMLLVTPATRLDLHLDPNELQTAVKWWLGVDTAGETSCSLCQDTALDLLGNHAATCKLRGDVLSRHNHLRDQVLEFYHHAHQVVRVEKGNGLTSDHSHLD